MYATIIDVTFKPEKRDEGIALTDELIAEMGNKVEGLRSFIALDRGNNKGTAIALYESKEAWEAAAPVAQEIMARLAPFLAEMPERVGAEVTNAHRFVKD